MIIGSSTIAAVRQPGDAFTTNDMAPPPATRGDTASVRPGAQGINRLSSEAATVVLAEQGAATPADTASGKAADASAATAKAPETTPLAKLDLHGQDLRAIDLSKLDLRSADLTGADLTGKDLSGVDLSGATLSGAKLDGATFSHTNLHGVTAIGASFAKASFDETDLDGGNFTEAKFTGASFNANFHPFGDCYIIKDVNLSKADFSDTVFAQEIFFERFTADDASFANAHSLDKMKSISFSKGSITNANFQNANIYIGIYGSNAAKSDFSHIGKGFIEFGVSNVDGTTFHDSGAELWFDRVDIRRADLSVKGKSLRGATFEDCNMSGMDFSGYDFTNASFDSYGPTTEGYGRKNGSIDTGQLVTNTNFHGANFTNAYFANIQMTKALINIKDLYGAVVSNNISSVFTIDGSHYNLNYIFRNIWPEFKARLVEIGRYIK